MSEVHASLDPNAVPARRGPADPVSALHARLAHQSLARPLTPRESELADALEAIYASGVTDPGEIAAALGARGLAPPARAGAKWTPELLDAELAAINLSLDAAYERG